MKFTISAFDNGAPIPGKFAFCVPADEGHVTFSDNVSPHMAWSDVPTGTKSFALICVDPDVPSVGDDVNQEGKTVPKDLPRVDFYHLVLVDIPADMREIAEGTLSDGVTPKGKEPGPTAFGVQGINNYTDWFAGDKDMGGNYGGYDGPCPPWNDEMVHHYHFRLYALDVESLGLSGTFGGNDALEAMDGHVLAEAEWMGTYTLNKDLL